MEKLIVKNFGALRNIEIQLKDLTVFIGETGTGKSTLAKLLSIFRSSDFWDGEVRQVEFFKRKLAYYQIANFLEPGTIIEYQSELGFYLIYNEENVRAGVSEKTLKYFYDKNIKIVDDHINNFIKDMMRESFNDVIYIPAERGVVSFLSEKYAALERDELIGLFPETLLDFTGTFNKVSSLIKKLYISLFDVTYQKENGKDYIILSNDKKFFLLESASGLQTVILGTFIIYAFVISTIGEIFGRTNKISPIVATK